jgi:hypothetical protein
VSPSPTIFFLLNAHQTCFTAAVLLLLMVLLLMMMMTPPPPHPTKTPIQQVAPVTVSLRQSSWAMPAWPWQLLRR